MNQELNEIISEISHAGTRNSMKMSEDLKTDFDILPQDFISYAEVDLASDYEHNIINALSNSKRALDCQLDILLLSFGYYKKSQKYQWNFPKKIDLMTELGLIAPRVLKKINKQRNLLEHQFVKPNRESVEDFLDITMLFIASTDRYSLNYNPQIWLKNLRFNRKYGLFSDYKDSKIKIKIYPYDKDGYGSEAKDVIKSFELTTSDEQYNEVLKIYLSYCK
jgi:hypothetical protein